MLKKFLRKQWSFWTFASQNFFKPMGKFDKMIDDADKDFNQVLDNLDKKNQMLIEQTKAFLEITNNLMTLSKKEDASEKFEKEIDQVYDNALNDFKNVLNQIKFDDKGNIKNKSSSQIFNQVLAELPKIQKDLNISERVFQELLKKEQVRSNPLNFKKKDSVQKLSISDLESLFNKDNSAVDSISNTDDLSTQINDEKQTKEQIKAELKEMQDSLLENTDLDEETKKIHLSLLKNFEILKLSALQEKALQRDQQKLKDKYSFDRKEF
ncbi:Dimethyladenosine transferase [Tieghemostelium lacteum]|uniref:Dimethyladenosine transferase n=1 Tax=Tieghemostelium lacteum TaxID=361077 RepID=A0A151Z6Y2_TIELA|nr:Dimethyladenosine transferase [Tieghemostelium lacteum]|eukprot:KYQ89544.1 Dimethyladenosine transferase [Tieghemostelium lacteum]